jgi:ribose transport system ATP-binding protein
VSEKATPERSELLIDAVGVAKHFGGEAALDRVDFELRPAEIHALLGENGAGKSTLIKVLAGVVQRDQGEIRLRGESLPRHLTPAIVRNAGLAFVHQTLGLMDGLSVAENIALATGYARRGGIIAFGATEKSVAELLDGLEVEVSPRALVGSLTQDQKVMVAVARALSVDAKTIVLDEVSSSLPAPEVSRLAEGLRAARRLGHGYVYVTHRIDEVFDFADRLTVLRDGRRIETTPVTQTSHQKVVAAILGERSGQESPASATANTSASEARDVRLRATSLRGGSMTEALDFEVSTGEIVAFCGLVGSGAQDVAAMLGGGLKPAEGMVEFDGAALRFGNVHALREAGCNYVPGDRQAAGGIFSMTVRDNLFLTRRRRGSQRDPRVRRPSRERRVAADLAERYDVRPGRSAEMSLGALSGGNQQKVIVGRALRKVPKLLVVEDPTAGVDIGSRRQIHEILRETVAAGTPIVLVSTDFDEIAELADRAFIFSHGRLHATLAREQASSDRLAEASYGLASEAHVEA